MPVGALERMEDGGELFREREEPAVGRRLLIAQSIDEATGCKTSGGDAGGEPRVVDFREEAGDLTPTDALAGLAGVAYEHDEEIQAVAGGIGHAVGPRPTRLPNAARSWRRMEAGWPSVWGAMVRTASPARPWRAASPSFGFADGPGENVSGDSAAGAGFGDGGGYGSGSGGWVCCSR